MDQELSISETFGVMLVGAFITMGVYGITTLQMYFYYMSYPKDDQSIKWLVGIIWILDTLHSVFMCHAVHYYLVQGFGNVALLGEGTWSLYSSVAINVLIAFISQSFFTMRIHRLSPEQHRWWISGLIGFTVVAHLCFGMETVAYFFIKRQFTRLKEILIIAALPFGITAVLSDIVIAAALCILLHSNRTEFEDTNHIINKLIVYAINRCLLTSIVAVIEVVLFSVIPNPFYTFGIDFVIGKLYANSLLAALNSRGSIRNTIVDCRETDMSTNFAATGVTTEYEQTISQMRSRDSARDRRYRLQALGPGGDVESKQTRTDSTLRNTTESSF